MPKPSREYTINWSHPLAAGLGVAVLHPDRGNLVTTGPQDLAISGRNGGEDISINRSGTMGALDAAESSAFALVEITGYTGSASIVTLPAYYEASNDSFLPQWQRTPQDTAQLTRYNSDGFDARGGEHAAPNGTVRAYALTMTGGSVRGYWDGIRKTSGPMSYRADARKGLGVAGHAVMAARVFLAWSRALSDAEQASLNADPYQIFELPRRGRNNQINHAILMGAA